MNVTAAVTGSISLTSTGQRKILQTWLCLISSSFFYAEHNSSTATSYRAHSLGLTSNKNNTDATFGLYPFLTCTNKPESTTQRFTVHQYKEATSVHQLVALTQQGVIVATAKKKRLQAPSSGKAAFFPYFHHNFWPSLDFWWSKMRIGRPKIQLRPAQTCFSHTSATNRSRSSCRAKASGQRKSALRKSWQRCRSPRSTSADWARWTHAEDTGTCSRKSCTLVSLPGSSEGLKCSIWP